MRAAEVTNYFEAAAVSIDRNIRPSAGLFAEFHHAGNFGEQGVVLADADIFAGEIFRAALAHENCAAFGGFAAEQLDAQTASGAVATVAG